MEFFKEGSESREVIQHLERLNANVSKQMSLGYVFRNGVMYGFGFVVGSTILTATLVTLIVTFAADTIFGDVIQWIVATLG